MVSVTHALKALGTTKQLISAISAVKEQSIMQKLTNVKLQLPQQYAKEEQSTTSNRILVNVLHTCHTMMGKNACRAICHNIGILEL